MERGRRRRRDREGGMRLGLSRDSHHTWTIPNALKHSEVLLWAINAPGGRWGQGKVVKVDSTQQFAQFLPNFHLVGTDVALRAHVAVQIATSQ
jgi:hypothetical protein